MNFKDSIQSFSTLLGTTTSPPLTKKELATIYAAAFGKYESGAYQEGADLFTQLILHDPFEPRYWKGLASCMQMQQNYPAALRAWATHALLTGHSPISHFHAAECYLSMGEKDEAIKALSLAEHYVKGKDPLKEKIDSLHEVLDG
jgi:type III secretion system low calcium response chaperone LcrH/SycD